MPGIGDVTARAAIASMAERGWSEEAFAQWPAPPRAREAHERLASLLRTLGGAHASSVRRGGIGEDAAVSGVSADIEAIRGLYDDILRERYDRPEPRLADLEQLRVIAGGYPSRAAFLAAIALEPPQSTQDLAGGGDTEDDALILSTAHSAKGKEWDAVFVIWAVDGFFPLARALADEAQLEEERRLLYVATTRARNHLAISYPLNVYSTRRGADYSMDQLSRFLDTGVRAKMQRFVLTEESTPSPEPPVRLPEQPTIDVRALARSRFAK
jgi:DNA helicase-2/ATP-dependent DNA helicase PcrA